MGKGAVLREVVRKRSLKRAEELRGSEGVKPVAAFAGQLSQAR